MQTYQITKVFEFSYGHRLLEHSGKCRYLHGHNGMLEIDISADSLDDMGMVLDFGEVTSVVKTWIDSNLDHRMLLFRQDPAVPGLLELGEPLFLMDENPTAENIARLVWLAAAGAGLAVSEVRLWETSTSRATYRAESWRE